MQHLVNLINTDRSSIYELEKTTKNLESKQHVFKENIDSIMQDLRHAQKAG
jgi:hypothetical protein